MPLSTPEAKAALATAVKEAVEEATSGLVAKNRELLGDLKEARKGKTIDPAEVEKLEAKIESLNSELATSQKAAKDALKASELSAKQFADESSFTAKLLIDNGLVNELAKNGVTNPINIKAAQAMLRGGVQVSADGNERVAKVGDKTLADHIKEWSASDEGKHFVTAQSNSGGGAGSDGKGNSGKKTVTRSAFDAMDQGARASFAKEGGVAVDD